MTKLKGGKTFSGIEGVIKHQHGSKLMEFLSPFNANKVLEAEMAAFSTLISLLEQCGKQPFSNLVNSNNKELVKTIQENLSFRDSLLGLADKGWRIKIKK